MKIKLEELHNNKKKYLESLQEKTNEMFLLSKPLNYWSENINKSEILNNFNHKKINKLIKNKKTPKI